MLPEKPVIKDLKRIELIAILIIINMKKILNIVFP